MRFYRYFCAIGVLFLLSFSTPSYSNSLREMGTEVKVGRSDLYVTPPKHWNKLSRKLGKFTETWTLDGEQLNDVTFYSAVVSGQPLIKERNKKKEPLPKFLTEMLLIEIPELLENTHRVYSNIGNFRISESLPIKFLGVDGIQFNYEYINHDNLPRKGEARAAIISGTLYMVTFEAPRIHYFDRTLEDFRALIDTAVLK